MGDINKVTTGEKVSFKAETFNTIADTVNLINRSRMRTGATDAKRGGGGNTIFVQNMSGADVLRGQVLGIDTPIMAPETDLDEFLTRVSFNGVTPVAGTHEGKFIVCLDKIATAGEGSGATPETGPGCISGICHALVNFINADDPCADIADGLTVLQSGASGAKILWKEEGTGEVWAILSLTENSMPAIYQATADQDSGSGGDSVTAKRIAADGTLGSEMTLNLYADKYKVRSGDFLQITKDGAGAGVAIAVQGNSGTIYTLPAGTDDTAETTTWDINDQPSGKQGVEVAAWFRLYWSGTSGDPVYQFVRKPKYDSKGALVFVSAEVRSEAFGTDTCEEA